VNYCAVFSDNPRLLLMLSWLVSSQKVELHKKIWVARLLRFRSFTGHTALCWAAALDHEEIVDLLFLHGGNPSVDDDVLIASADLIRAAWHYYCWKKSPQRAGRCSNVDDCSLLLLMGCIVGVRDSHCVRCVSNREGQMGWRSDDGGIGSKARHSSELSRPDLRGFVQLQVRPFMAAVFLGRVSLIR
jgi:hypothetical protein